LCPSHDDGHFVITLLRLVEGKQEVVDAAIDAGDDAAPHQLTLLAAECGEIGL
jgi:hypothetical protein